MVGDRKKCRSRAPDLEPTPEADQSRLRPSAHSGRIGQAYWVLAVRCGLLGSITGGDVLTGLLPAVQAVMAGWRQPIGQGREGLSARPADSTPHPNAFVLVIVALAQSPSMADDRVVTANRTSPR